MLLLVAATELEMRPVVEAVGSRDGISFLVSGMGLFETTLKLTAFLAGNAQKIHAVMNIGVGGGLPGAGVDILDICLAKKEILGDFGICHDGRIEDFDAKKLPVRNEFEMDRNLRIQSESILRQNEVDFLKGSFVTVQCASGTNRRGEFFRNKYNALCENMEGAAVAGVCNEFGIPCLEMRCISNLVEDRDLRKWKLEEACERMAYAAAILVAGFENNMRFTDQGKNMS